MKALFFVLMLVFVLPTFGQTTTAPKISEMTAAEPCGIKLSESPTIRGLRLGTEKAEVAKKYPKMTFTGDAVVGGGIALSHQITDLDYLENIDRIMVSFRNGKIFSVAFTYDTSIKWDSLEEFAFKISESLKLPKPVMRKRGADNIYYSVNCGEFIVRTRITSEKQPVLLLSMDPNDVWETTKQRKDAFKP